MPDFRDRIIELRRVKGSDLRPNPENWRRHPEHQSKALRASLEDIGFAGAVLARETEDGLELIDGHLRQEVADDAADEARRLLLSLDPLAAMAETDPEALADLLKNAELGNEELEKFLAAQVPDVKKLGQTDAESIPELPSEATTKLGDVWELGDHRLLCGDATQVDDVERLLGGERPNLVWADPPYGIDYRAMRRADVIQNDSHAADALRVTTDALGLVFNASAHFVCCSWRSLATITEAMETAGIEAKACIVWDKQRGVQNLDRFFKQHEFIVYSGPYGGEKTVGGDVWAVARDFDPDHPTPKPVGLVEKALESASMQGATVYDPFAGSGPSVIAAERTSRKCRAVELDPRYCDVIVKRWEDFTGRKAERAETAKAS